MKLDEYMNGIREVFAEEELTPRFVRIIIGTTVAFLISFGVISHVIISHLLFISNI